VHEALGVEFVEELRDIQSINNIEWVLQLLIPEGRSRGRWLRRRLPPPPLLGAGRHLLLCRSR
jgi:hypothetical protein